MFPGGKARQLTRKVITMTKHNNDKPEYQNRPSTRDLPAGDKFVPQKGSVSYADTILDGQGDGYAGTVRPGNKLNCTGK
jgi:hypothetical protein